MLNDLLTMSEIAQHLGVRFYRVRYLLTARPEIRPTEVVRGTRLFDAEAVRKIAAELEAIDEKRRTRVPA